MKNRAKCKLCNSIIESFHSTDYVTCQCGEISVDGGSALYCSATDFSNFLRVDDEGNEIIVELRSLPGKAKKESLAKEGSPSKPSRDELLDMLDMLIKNIENLPDHAMATPINHYDFASALITLSAILRSS